MITIEHFMQPGLVICDGIKYVVPGWVVVPMETQLSDLQLKVPSYISQKPKTEWTVTSQSSGTVYRITKDGDTFRCTCPGWKFRGQCKHTQEIKNQLIN